MRRIHYRSLCALLFLTLVLVPSKKADSKPRHFSPDPTAIEFVEKVNALRTSKGLNVYETNPSLMAVAQKHADYIASTGVLTHFDDKGLRPFQRAMAAGYPVAGDLSLGGLFAEAIFSGSGISDDDVIRAWQGDTADALAILSPEYKDVGVGISAANGLTYYVLNAGSDTESGTSTTASPTVISRTVTPGTVIPNTALPNGEVYHIVQKNEALWSIALAYGTTIAELKLLNSLASDEIFEGQRLLIRRASTETPTPTPMQITATLGLPTSTPTSPVTPTVTQTSTPLPAPPTTIQSGGAVVGGITLFALLAAGVIAFLSRSKK